MTKTNIIIADTNIELIKELEQIIGYDPNLNLLAFTTSGKELLELLNDEVPNVIIMDLILRDLDGLGILKCISELPSNKRPKIIILSSLWNETTLDVVLQYDVQYYLLKPMETEHVISRIKDFSCSIDYIDNICKEQLCATHVINKTQGKLTVKHMTSNILRQLGFPAHMSAYNYLLHAVEIAVHDPCAVNMITKKIYPLVAEKYNTLEARVERSLRYLIETAWKNIDEEVLYHHFALSLKASNKPASGELIAVIADKIRLELAEA